MSHMDYETAHTRHSTATFQALPREDGLTALGRGDLRVIMTTMKLKCTYVARVIAATDDLHGWTVLRAKHAPLTR